MHVAGIRPHSYVIVRMYEEIISVSNSSTSVPFCSSLPTADIWHDVQTRTLSDSVAPRLILLVEPGHVSRQEGRPERWRPDVHVRTSFRSVLQLQESLTDTCPTDGN
ncbi:hypothetical protein Bbelb_408200 [Branchiostoma belcheri]|nr:hypothetical protein Bbelb_408200 [Branchiostoma belcheri]